jgi:phosphoribosylaminoimidazole carboxylase PurE protein
MTTSVAILMGSESDLEVMKGASEVLTALSVGHEMRVLSAHRTPEDTAAFIREAEGRGVKVFIAGAGAAAHLAGAVVAHTVCPVIGVPLNATPLGGLDALLSTVQMPSGVPVATMAVGGAQNAGLYAATILAVSDEALRGRLQQRKRDMRDKVLAADARVRAGAAKK